MAQAIDTAERSAAAERTDVPTGSAPIPPAHSKKIQEYTGVYDAEALSRLIEGNNAQGGISEADLPITDNKVLSRRSDNTLDSGSHIKIHTRMLMFSQEDASGRKLRFKVGSEFKGRLSKRQFQVAGYDILTAANPTADTTLRTAGEMHLESDETDVFGRLLYSQESAEILTTRLKKTGERVHGFFLNGQYVTDEGQRVSEEEARPAAASSGKATTPAPAAKAPAAAANGAGTDAAPKAERSRTEADADDEEVVETVVKRPEEADADDEVPTKPANGQAAEQPAGQPKEQAAEQPAGQAAGQAAGSAVTVLHDMQDMKWRDRRSRGDQEKVEKLRAAIRKSFFFQHVNARTIQYYTSYQVDEDYTNAVDTAVSDREAEAGDGSIGNAVRRLMRQDGERELGNIPAGIIGPVIATYILTRMNQRVRRRSSYHGTEPVLGQPA